MSGNICRCGTYQRIRSATKSGGSFVVGLQLVPRSSIAAAARPTPGVATPLCNPTAFVSIEADGLGCFPRWA
jgi:hypothetical protein